jgi:hypothetical protein
MEEKSFVTAEELGQIQEIQKEYDKVSKDLGFMELHKMALEEQRQSLNNYIQQLRGKEMELGKSFNEKYGKVNIDPVTGEIIPIKNEQ